MKKLALTALTLCALLGGVAQGQDKAADQKRADAAAQQNARGAALLKDGKFEEATAELQKAAEGAPKSAVIQSNLGYAYDKQGRTDEAEEEVRRRGRAVQHVAGDVVHSREHRPGRQRLEHERGQQHPEVALPGDDRPERRVLLAEGDHAELDAEPLEPLAGAVHHLLANVGLAVGDEHDLGAGEVVLLSGFRHLPGCLEGFAEGDHVLGEG